MPDETCGFHFPVVFGGVAENDVAIFHMPSRGRAVCSKSSMSKAENPWPRLPSSETEMVFFFGRFQSRAQRHEYQEAWEELALRYWDGGMAFDEVAVVD